MKPILETTADDIRGPLEFSVIGAVAAVQAVLGPMREAGRGTILFTTGAAFINPQPASAPGSASRSRARSPTRACSTTCWPSEDIHVAHTAINGRIAPGERATSPARSPTCSGATTPSAATSRPASGSTSSSIFSSISWEGFSVVIGLAVTARSASMDSRMSSARSCSSGAATQRSNAILKTAMAASAVTGLVGSKPRWRRAAASAAASDASLISSRSAAPGGVDHAAAARATLPATAKQPADGLEARRRSPRPGRRRRGGETVDEECLEGVAPAKSTSRLSAKWRKNVRSVRPARAAMSATVVWS